MLCDLLEDIPLAKNTADSVERIAAVSVALNSLLEGRSTTRYAVRIMLYELMTLAFVSGGISGVERRFLEIFKQHHQVDDSDFAEILERTETTFHEVQKTIALVLE